MNLDTDDLKDLYLEAWRQMLRSGPIMTPPIRHGSWAARFGMYKYNQAMELMHTLLQDEI